MPKSLVFISHITEEAAIAIEFKSLIEKHFLGLIDVFVSSDGASIKMGQKWLQDISDALADCAVEIVICSPESVKRPWINFEAGAGWVRGIPVIPLCHSGMEPSDLPVPLNLLQAAKSTDISNLNLVIPVLAKAIEANSPKIDFTDFIEKVKDFESNYTHWNSINKAFEYINRLHPKIIDGLKTYKEVKIPLAETHIFGLASHVELLRRKFILDFKREGTATMTDQGMYYDCIFSPMSNFIMTVKHKNFGF